MRLRRAVAVAVPPVVVFVGLTLAAEWYLRRTDFPRYILPRPSAVFSAAGDGSFGPALARSLWATASAALLGFGASVVVGIVIAVALSSARVVRNAFYPYTIFFQTVPVVAIAPLLVIWFGAGLKSVAICAFVVSVFPVIANTLAGLLSTDPALRDLFKLYRAGPLARLFKLRLPWATPNIITGLRIAAGLAVIGAIVGEFVAGELTGDAGVGVLVATYAKYGRVDRVFAAILAASLLGLAMLCTVNVAGYLLLRHWHASARAD